MPSYLYTDFTAQVKRIAKVETTALDALVTDAINMSIHDVAMSRDIPQLLVHRHVPTFHSVEILAGKATQLPVDFLRIDQFIYRVSSGAPAVVREWELAERSGRIPPAPIYGKPRAYAIVTGTGLTLNGVANNDVQSAFIFEPHAAYNGTTDTFYVDYYKVPPFLSEGGSTKFLGQSDATEVIARAADYLMTYQNKLPQAQAMMQPYLQQMQKAANIPTTSDPPNTQR